MVVAPMGCWPRAPLPASLPGTPARAQAHQLQDQGPRNLGRAEQWGETVKALVVPRAGVAADADELVAFARARPAGYKLPRDRIRGALPRTPSGKVLTRAARALRRASK